MVKLIYIPLLFTCGLLCLKCATGEEEEESDGGPDILDMPAMDPDMDLDAAPDPGVDAGSDAVTDALPDIAADADDYGDLCKSCGGSEECGGPDDHCLRNSDTGEIFCARHCASGADCPAGFLCEDIPADPPTKQCVPAGGTCADMP